MAGEKRRAPIRSTLLALGTGGLLLLLIVASMIYLVYRTQDYIDGAARARQLRSTAADLLLAVQDAETGQRGYILTREKTFLTPYIESIRDLDRREAAFERTLAINDFIHIEPLLVRDTIAEKLSELRSTLALAQAGKQDEALAVIRDESGLRLMNNIRAMLTGVIETADRQISAQFANNLRLAGILRIVTIIGALAMIGVMIGAGLVIRRYLQEISDARAELETMNVSLEERVRKRTEDLIQANQEIQRYAYIVTHDLRAPLVNIMGFTSELDGALKTINAYFQEEDSLNSEDRKRDAMFAVREDLPEAISFIRSSTRKMDDLINAILKISRDGRRQLKPESIDLNEMIKVAGAVIQHQVQEAQGEIAIEVTARDFVSDRFSMEQIVGNLFDNAVKYRHQSRPLRLSVRAFPVDRFTIGIDVSDNGRGVAEEDQERIFELFRRSGAQDSPGEGIGLAHVRSLVRNMGGDIRVTSELGAGTTFMIRMPSDLSRFVRSQGR